MANDAPPFWYKKPGVQALLLAPIAQLYGRIAAHRMCHARRQILPVPVLCVGNFTVGGTGKTPTAIALSKAAIKKGLTPGILTRGYGGTSAQPTLVDPGHHSAKYVGDEPLLLAKMATTIVAKDRVAGAQKLLDEGVDLILMDDGFQSAHLHFDYAVLVVDAMRGLGNEKIIPAGPVRAPLNAQMQYADALTVIGEGDAADGLVRIAARAAKPVFNGFFKATEPENFQNLKCLAFAAIGDPDRFFRSLKALGAQVVASRAFQDHHYFTEQDIDELLMEVQTKGLTPVTTRKDFVRLVAAHGRADELAKMTKVLDIELTYDDASAPDLMIAQTLANFKKRAI